MSTKKFRPYNPNETYLFPPSPQDWLPENHPAHFVNEVVAQLDLGPIYQSYDALRGYPPYHPTMMVKVWIYAVMKGIHSSRKVEKALYEDIGFRFLSGNQQPDHWTLSEFRRRHHKALGELFVQTVRLAATAGLVKLNHVVLDGTKIKANASKHSAMSYARMEKEEERLRREIERIFREIDANDRDEDRKYGNRRGDELPPELATRQKRLEAIKRAKAELEAEARAKEEARRKEKGDRDKPPRRRNRNKPTKPEEIKPEAKAQRNFTDPDSRIMKDSNKAFIQGYNAQAGVDAETHIIVTAELTNQAGDTVHLPDQVEQVRQNTGHYPKEVSADAGYCSEKNLTFLEEKGIEAFIPPEKVTHSEWRERKSPRGRIPQNASRKYLMRRKLTTKRGRERYKLRQTSVEPVFGHVKEQLGLRQFLLRGLSKVRSWWRFTCAVHNLLKLYRAGLRFQNDGKNRWIIYQEV